MGAEAQTVVREKRQGAPGWLWTFADLMSLLFALFVLILTFVKFDTGKFHQTMDPVRDSFKQGGTGQASAPRRGGLHDLPMQSGAAIDVVDYLEKEEVSRLKRQTLARLNIDLADEMASGFVDLQETDRGVILRFPSATAFDSGGGELNAAMIPVLDRVAEILRALAGSIAVSGHTDDVAIATERYRSNWDLSTTRAVSVVHRLILAGIAPARINATGFADTRPLVANTTPEQRARNRRVEIEVVIDARSKHGPNEP